MPLHNFTRNQIWCAFVMPAAEVPAWTQLLALTDDQAHRWDPNGSGSTSSSFPLR